MGEIEPAEKRLVVSEKSRHKQKVLSGKEVMDLFVEIADEATKLFNVDMLYNSNFIYNVSYPYYTEGSYSLLVYQALKNTGRKFNDREMPFGWAIRHRIDDRENPLKKHELEKVLGSLTIVENGLFEESEESDLMTVEYHIDFPWDDADGYFCEEWLPGWFEELGVPKLIIPFLSNAYATKEKIAGKKDFYHVAREIQGMIKKINPDGTRAIDIAGGQADIFLYKNNIFYFRPKADYQSEILPKDITHSVTLPQLYWAYAIYNTRLLKPIGYSILKFGENNDPGKNLRKLLQPGH